jgi:hypothetical protein
VCVCGVCVRCVCGVCDVYVWCVCVCVVCVWCVCEVCGVCVWCVCVLCVCVCVCRDDSNEQLTTKSCIFSEFQTEFIKDY